eukprot:gene20302-24310_t
MMQVMMGAKKAKEKKVAITDPSDSAEDEEAPHKIIMEYPDLKPNISITVAARCEFLLLPLSYADEITALKLEKPLTSMIPVMLEHDAMARVLYKSRNEWTKYDNLLIAELSSLRYLDNGKVISHHNDEGSFFIVLSGSVAAHHPLYTSMDELLGTSREQEMFEYWSAALAQDMPSIECASVLLMKRAELG